MMSLEQASGVTISGILARWREEAAAARYNRNRDQGTAFEKLCIAFLTHDPVHNLQYEPPVTWAEWAKERGEDAQDTGIDLVAKIRGEEGYCAIQCKFWSKQLQKKEIDAFLAKSSRKEFNRRLLIDTNGLPLSSPMENTLRLQEKPVIRIQLEDFVRSRVDWAEFVAGEKIVEKFQERILRPHQQDALEAVIENLQQPGSRGKVFMACGSGKTLTAQRIAEGLVGEGGRVLCLVPSLALMAQAVRCWAEDQVIPLRAFAACSDSQIGRRKSSASDQIDMDVLDLALPATTDATRLTGAAGKYTPGKLNVIFATYHSLPVIRQAQQEHGLPAFDLAICDEAHRTAGGYTDESDRSCFTMIHDDDLVGCKRRLYMTATPKVYSSAAREQASGKLAQLCSMDDEELFGPVLYELGFAAAVEKDLLSDYKVVVLVVPEQEAVVSGRDTTSKGTVGLDDAGKLIGCWRALAKVDAGEFPENDRQPMARAIAYCGTIAKSKAITVAATDLSGEGRDTITAKMLPEHPLDVRHVDGTMRSDQRAGHLQWLAAEGGGESRVLCNVRCLSEGVDVPTLDAIIFMHPRKSQIDVVQAVGRVMRKAEGKKLGYVLLPVVVPFDEDPAESLNNNKTFEVVWQVLNAIRSHDQRFDAMINLLEEGQESDQLGIIFFADDWQPGGGGGGSGDRPDPPIAWHEQHLPAAIKAKIVEKCGNRKYWSEWAHDVADIARRHIVRIQDLVTADEDAQEIFEIFLGELRKDLNQGISDQDAIEMLAQHMVTRPVFEALLGDWKFADSNPVSAGMQMVLDVLKDENIEKEAEGLEEFYNSVQRRAEAATTAEARQKLLVELYDQFFQGAFPRTVERMGIVYTPVPVVDFILRSVGAVLEDEFDHSLGTRGVHILDPFTGTGTFITRMIQLGLLTPEQLIRKWQVPELHANEMVLLAYYVAAVNIEAAWHAETGAETYAPFKGICLSDTFETDRESLFTQILPGNSKARDRQNKAPIRVIIGNPPWSTGQKNQNDNAANQPYPQLDQRIRETYAQASKATSLRNLYDSYVRAIRWASDRIGDSGIIGFITGSAWLERSFADGLRKCLAEEFTKVHVFHLRGDIRKDWLSGGLAGEGASIFDGMVGSAIFILVKNPKASGRGQILFHSIGDNLERETKLAIIKDFGSIHGIGVEGGWTEITPDEHHDWLDQRDAGFQDFLMIGSKDKALSDEPRLFHNYSLGVATSRDAWCCNASCLALESNIRAMIDAYNAELVRFAQEGSGSRATVAQVRNFVGRNPKKINWSRALVKDVRIGKALVWDDGHIAPSMYRPFTRQYLYFSRRLNDMVYQMPRIFPHAEAENRCICVAGIGARSGFSVLMVDAIATLGIIESGQCLPLWLYDKAMTAEGGLLPKKTDAHGYVRREAITEEGLRYFQSAFGPKVTKRKIFNYVYGLLHLPSYRERFKNNLAKELPRIPLPREPEHFETLAEAGRLLGEMHVGYERADPWPIEFEKGGWEPPRTAVPPPEFLGFGLKNQCGIRENGKTRTAQRLS